MPRGRTEDFVFRDDETPSASRTTYPEAVHDEYTSLCKSAANTDDPLKQRSVHNHLSDLHMLGILSKYENRSGSRGNYYSYELDVPFESAVDAMADVLMFDAELEKIQGVASRNSVR
nr:hypothetical protein [Halobacterium salinarum]